MKTVEDIIQACRHLTRGERRVVIEAIEGSTKRGAKRGKLCKKGHAQTPKNLIQKKVKKRNAAGETVIYRYDVCRICTQEQDEKQNARRRGKPNPEAVRAGALALSRLRSERKESK